MITRYQFAVALLNSLGIAEPSTAAVLGIVAQETMEDTKAINNPLATTWNMELPGETEFNAAGVQNYPNINGGLAATVNTLKMSDYDSIRAALVSGSYEDVVNAIDASPWGTKNVASITIDQATAEQGLAIASADELPGIPAIPGEPPEVPPAAPVSIKYTIQPGDTLSGIAERFHVADWQTIYEANAELLNAVARARGFADAAGGNLIWPGTTIQIP